MRSSISAQSCDSVPPAPGWMVTIAFLRSCSPPSIFLISPACTSWSSASSAWRELGVDRLAGLRPTRPARRGRRSSSSARAIRSRSCSSRRRRCSTFCASAWSFQKSGAAARASRRVSSSSGRGASKIAPQIGSALAEILVAAHQLVDGSHAPLLYTRARDDATARPSRAPTRTRRRRRCARRSVDVFRNRASPTTTAGSKDRGALEHAPVRIDDAADAGVGGAHQIAALLDRAHRRLLEVLVRRRRRPEPGVVGDRRQQLAAAGARTRRTSAG